MYAVFTLDMANKWVESNLDRVNRVVGQMGYKLKMDHFKQVKNRFRSIGLRVGLICILHMTFIYLFIF